MRQEGIEEDAILAIMLLLYAYDAVPFTNTLECAKFFKCIGKVFHA